MMKNADNQQATLLDLISESFGLPEKGVMRLALAAMVFWVARYVMGNLVG
jgi:hypothetical protein